MTTIGIIGLGAFGRFAASLVPQRTNIRVLGFDQRQLAADRAVEQTDFAAVAGADIVLLAVPLAAYPAVLERLQPLLRPEALLVDVCSVKVLPQQLVHKHVPGHANLLITHPLFGPQSAAKTTKGHTLVVCESTGEAAQEAIDFCEQQLGLRIQHMTAEEHDRHMAHIHALTFFVARGLKNAGLHELPFSTPSFRMLLDLVRLDESHSDELFQTIQQGNPFADEARQHLIKTFQELEAALQPLPQGETNDTVTN